MKQPPNTQPPVAKKVTHNPNVTMHEVNLDPFISPQDIATAADQLLDFDVKLNSNETVIPYFTSKTITVDKVDKNIQPDNHHFVIDSGAYPHMWNKRHEFITFKSWNPSLPTATVSLADGVSTAKIEGFGSVAFRLGNTTQILHNVLFIPTLSSSLLSVKQHSETQGNYFHAEGGEAILAFKDYVTSFPMNQPQILVKYKPISTPQNREIYNLTQQLRSSTKTDKSTPMIFLLVDSHC